MICEAIQPESFESFVKAFYPTLPPTFIAPLAGFPPPNCDLVTPGRLRKVPLSPARASPQPARSPTHSAVMGERHVAEESDDGRIEPGNWFVDASFLVLEGGLLNPKVLGDVGLEPMKRKASCFEVFSNGFGLN